MLRENTCACALCQEYSFDATQWAVVLGFPTYLISRDGVVQNRLTGRIIRCYPDKDGYRIVRLTKGGKVFRKRVHRVVFEAWVRPLEAGEEVDHDDFDRQNNRLSNLNPLMGDENWRRSYDAGHYASGPRGPQKNRRGLSRTKKLTDEEARSIFDRATAGEPQRALAAEFGITQPAVSAIATKRRRTHLHADRAAV